MRVSTNLGLAAAGTTILAALLTPFLLIGSFSRGFVALRLHVDEIYSGGPIVRTTRRGAYTVAIHAPVSPHLLQGNKAFIQLDWGPISALPRHISDAVDIDGDGQPDVRVSFDIPSDAKAALHVGVEPLNPRYQEMRNVGKESFFRLIARIDNRIIVRLPSPHP